MSTTTATGSFNLGVGNGGNLNIGSSGELAHTSAGGDMVAQQQTVPTSWTALSLGACATAGLLLVKNTDPTNYVQLATANDNSGVFAKLVAGKAGALWPPDPGATLYARANTASCVVEIVAIET